MIYLDANASSRLRPQAAQAIRELIGGNKAIGNPSSAHRLGQEARYLVSKARGEVLGLLGFNDSARVRLVFCSGGTEAANAIIFGACPKNSKAGHIVATAIEHQSVIEPIEFLRSLGWEASLVRTTPAGAVDCEELVNAVTEATTFVAIMAANNVTGALQPVARVTEAIRRKGSKAFIFSDLSQAVGKTEISVKHLFDMGLDAVSISGHKIGAPCGVGAFVIRNEVLEAGHDGRPRLLPLLLGGPQEYRLRAGTENCLGIAALGAVARHLAKTLGDDLARLSNLREAFFRMLEKECSGLRRIVPTASEGFLGSLSNTLALVFNGVSAEDLVVALDLEGVCVSTGSACSSGKQEVSHVYRGMQMSEEDAKSAIRISLDWDADRQVVEDAALKISNVVSRIRSQVGNQ